MNVHPRHRNIRTPLCQEALHTHRILKYLMESSGLDSTLPTEGCNLVPFCEVFEKVSKN